MIVSKTVIGRLSDLHICTHRYHLDSQKSYSVDLHYLNYCGINIYLITPTPRSCSNRAHYEITYLHISYENQGWGLRLGLGSEVK